MVLQTTHHLPRKWLKRRGVKHYSELRCRRRLEVAGSSSRLISYQYLTGIRHQKPDSNRYHTRKADYHSKYKFFHRSRRKMLPLRNQYP